MGFVRSVAARSRSTSSLSRPEAWVEDWFAGGGAPNGSGVFVSEQTALHYAPFFAGVQVISGDIGALPLPVYERLPRGKRRAPDHALYRVLHDQPNPYMTPLALRETLTGHALTWGGGYAYIERTGSGQADSLWPLRPDRIEPFKLEEEQGEREERPGKFRLLYRYWDPQGRMSILLPDEVLHIAGLGFDGVRGYSLVQMARNSIGLGLATERFGSAFFGNGSRPGGILTHPGRLSDGARERMRTDWENLHRGLDRSQRVAILEEGVTWHQIGIPPNDAQFLETRKLQVTEAARWLRLPPHKLGDLERSTFSNIEHQGIDYVTSALRVWLVRWEQAIHTRLFTAGERARFFAEHLVDALLRGDIKTRYEAYAIGRNWGWLSADDIRELENMNPLPEQRGTVYLVPLNMVPAPLPGEADAPVRMARALRGRSFEARRRTAESFAPAIAAADRGLAELERAEVARLAREHLADRGTGAAVARSVTGFLTAVWQLYRTVILGRTIDRLTPPLHALMVEVIADAVADVGFDGEIDLQRWLRAYVASHADYRINSAYGQIRAVVEAGPADPVAEVVELLDKWVEVRPERTADWQTTQLTNAASREAWRAAGVPTVGWVAVGDNCGWCGQLDGRQVPIDQAFVTGGTRLTDGDKEFVIYRDIHNPPLHPGCDCHLVAG